MIMVIRPLVQEPRHHRQAVDGIATYAVGVLSGALLVGVAWAVLGLAVQRVVPARQAVVVVAAACFAMALLDFGVRGARPLTVRRQTCSAWWRRFGPARAWFYWGLDLGLGVTTYRATSLYWAAVLTAVLLAPPAFTPLIMAVYAVGLVTNLAIGSLALCRTGLLQPGRQHPMQFL